jgi:hypothetical protein
VVSNSSPRQRQEGYLEDNSSNNHRLLLGNLVNNPNQREVCLEVNNNSSLLRVDSLEVNNNSSSSLLRVDSLEEDNHKQIQEQGVVCLEEEGWLNKPLQVVSSVLSQQVRHSQQLEGFLVVELQEALGSLETTLRPSQPELDFLVEGVLLKLNLLQVECLEDKHSQLLEEVYSEEEHSQLLEEGYSEEEHSQLLGEVYSEEEHSQLLREVYSEELPNHRQGVFLEVSKHLSHLQEWEVAYLEANQHLNQPPVGSLEASQHNKTQVYMASKTYQLNQCKCRML